MAGAASKQVQFTDSAQFQDPGVPRCWAPYGGFPKLGVPFLGGPYNKDCSLLFWGLYWGPILGNYHKSAWDS